eukprot:6202195-Pleurochrysis_carterae.AAC.1
MAPRGTRTRKISERMRVFDEDTRREITRRRLESLEKDNWQVILMIKGWAICWGLFLVNYIAFIAMRWPVVVQEERRKEEDEDEEEYVLSASRCAFTFPISRAKFQTRDMSAQNMYGNAAFEMLLETQSDSLQSLISTSSEYVGKSLRHSCSLCVHACALHVEHGSVHVLTVAAATRWR